MKDKQCMYIVYIKCLTINELYVMGATHMSEKGRVQKNKQQPEREREKEAHVKHVENCRVTFKIFNCNNCYLLQQIKHVHSWQNNVIVKNVNSFFFKLILAPF